MRQIIYTLQFNGQASPVSESSNVLKTATTASSCIITTVIGNEGVEGSIKATEGDNATFESEVTFTGEASFKESGVITFGESHRLHFSTVGQGHIDASVDPNLKHGSVIWKIERGEGQLQGATGLITSNFSVSDLGEVTDNHFGVIFLK